MKSAMRERCRGSTPMPYAPNTPDTSLTMVARHASTPYAASMAAGLLHDMRAQSIRSCGGGRAAGAGGR
jgi:hypothetical protein